MRVRFSGNSSPSSIIKGSAVGRRKSASATTFWLPLIYSSSTPHSSRRSLWRNTLSEVCVELGWVKFLWSILMMIACPNKMSLKCFSISAVWRCQRTLDQYRVRHQIAHLMHDVSCSGTTLLPVGSRRYSLLTSWQAQAGASGCTEHPPTLSRVCIVLARGRVSNPVLQPVHQPSSSPESERSAQVLSKLWTQGCTYRGL